MSFNPSETRLRRVEMDIIKKIKSDGNSFKELSRELERLMSENVLEGYPGSWTMDTVAERFVTGLRNTLDGKRIVYPGKSMRTRLWAYKLIDDREAAMGDIAILVRMSYHDAHRTEGAVLLQGALKDPDKNTFSGLKRDALRKAHSISPHAWLMLCDYDTISGMAYPALAEYVIGNHPQGGTNWISYTNSVLVPAGLALELGVKTTGLYKASVPLSHQFCHRFLMGLDLDYHQLARDVARGAKKDRGIARYLLLISVSLGGAEGSSDSDFDINRELYSPL